MTSFEKIEADVAIIGSGVAGAMAACRLAEKGIRNIVMLEAGPRISRADIVTGFRNTAYLDASAGYPNPDWAPRPVPQGKYIEQTGPVDYSPQYLRVVGGTTWHWGGVVPRLLPSDFRLKSTYGIGTDWPIDYDTLEPFYAAAEEEFGVAGENDPREEPFRSTPYPLPAIPFGYADRVVAKGLAAAGLRLVTRPVARASLPYRGRAQCMGFGTCSPICPSGAHYSAICHVEQAEKLGVRVMENSRADRIVTGGGATAIEAQRPDGQKITVRAKVFIIAANGIETPRLLLMSAGESAPAGIANSSGMVGRNFMDHPALVCRMTLPEPVWSGRGPQNISVSNTFRDGAFRKTRPGWVLSLENRVHFHDITRELLAADMEPPDLDAAIKDRACREVELDIGSEHLPDEQNSITLDWGRRDTAGQPVMKMRYAFSAYEQAGFAHARDMFARIAAALGAKSHVIRDPIPQHHLMGMTRMGADPKTSVTDSYGRCHDHRNLFLLSSSLFPTGGNANPTLTLAALTLRAADEIARQLKG